MKKLPNHIKDKIQKIYLMNQKIDKLVEEINNYFKNKGINYDSENLDSLGFISEGYVLDQEDLEETMDRLLQDINMIILEQKEKEKQEEIERMYSEKFQRVQ